MARSSNRHGKPIAFRSGLEEVNAEYLTKQGIRFEYETLRIPFVVEEVRHYKPDLLLPNGIIVELKGRWETADRKKHRLLHAQYPDLDIRYVFSRPVDRISKQSQTTYAQFCETQGWKYAAKLVPLAWAREPHNTKSLAALARLRSSRD